MTRNPMSNGAGTEPRVYVIHENDAWLEPLRKEFAAHGVLAGTIAPGVIRLVTHHDVDDDGVERARTAIATAP